MLNTLMLVLLVLQLAIGIRLLAVYLWRLPVSIELIYAHALNGFIIFTLVLVHLYMNRRWMMVQLFGSKPKK